MPVDEEHVTELIFAPREGRCLVCKEKKETRVMKDRGQQTEPQYEKPDTNDKDQRSFLVGGLDKTDREQRATQTRREECNDNVTAGSIEEISTTDLGVCRPGRVIIDILSDLYPSTRDNLLEIYNQDQNGFAQHINNLSGSWIGCNQFPSSYYMVTKASNGNAHTTMGPNTTIGNVATQFSLFEHILNKYGIKLKWPELPLIDVQRQSSSGLPFPLELCFLAPSPPQDAEIESLFSNLSMEETEFAFVLVPMEGGRSSCSKQTQYFASSSPFQSLHECVSYAFIYSCHAVTLGQCSRHPNDDENCSYPNIETKSWTMGTSKCPVCLDQERPLGSRRVLRPSNALSAAVRERYFNGFEPAPTWTKPMLASLFSDLLTQPADRWISFQVSFLSTPAPIPSRRDVFILKSSPIERFPNLCRTLGFQYHCHDLRILTQCLVHEQFKDECCDAGSDGQCPSARQEWRMGENEKCPLCLEEEKQRKENDKSKRGSISNERSEEQEGQLVPNGALRREESGEDRTPKSSLNRTDPSSFSATSPTAEPSVQNTPCKDTRKRKRRGSSVSNPPPASFRSRS